MLILLRSQSWLQSRESHGLKGSFSPWRMHRTMCYSNSVSEEEMTEHLLEYWDDL